VNENDGGVCARCGSPRADFQYCVNCGYDSATETVSTDGTTDGSAAERIASLVLAQGPQVAATGSGLELSASSGSVNRSTGQTSPSLSAGGSGRGSTGRRLALLGGIAAALLVGFMISRVLGADDASVVDAPGAVDDTVAASPSANTSDNSSESAAPSESASASTSASESATPDAVEKIQCWNGSTASLLTECSFPAGERGISWVFPSLKTKSCESISVPDRRQAWECQVKLPGGGRADVVYTELRSVHWGVTHFSNLYSGKLRDDGDGTRFVWAPRRLDGKWIISSMYVHRRWAVDINADSPKAVKQALRQVRFRPSNELRGAPRPA
jgi:hypothetical protein